MSLAEPLGAKVEALPTVQPWFHASVSLHAWIINDAASEWSTRIKRPLTSNPILPRIGQNLLRTLALRRRYGSHHGRSSLGGATAVKTSMDGKRSSALDSFANRNSLLPYGAP